MKQNATANSFRTLELAYDVIAAIRPDIGAIASADKSLADQLRRAASSVPLNLAEGSGRKGNDKLHFYRIASGSAKEVVACLRAASTWGDLSGEGAVELADRLAGATWRLSRAA